jgi:hypothetical protein
MIDLTKEQVLSCMGVPAAKATEGASEVWTCNSGNGHYLDGQSTTNVAVVLFCGLSLAGLPHNAS